MQKINSFNGLRFICAVWIVLCHLVSWSFKTPFFHTAFLAVEVFLILSGFLLAKSYEKMHASSNLLLCRKYFFRRFKRLWPEYIFSVFLTYCFFNSFGQGVWPQHLGLNLAMMAGQGGIHHIQEGVWYIAVLMWGGCLLFNILVFGKDKAKTIILPLISFLCLFFLTNHGGVNGHLVPIDYELINRGFIRGLLGLTVGIYTYWICDFLKAHKLPLKKEWTNRFLLLGEFISVIALFYTFTFQKIADSSDFNIYFYISFLIGLLSFRKETLLKFLSWKFWAPFGKVSYMLYLTHFIVIDIFKTQWGEWGTQHLLLTYCIILPTAVVLAFCCYWEQKWLFGKLKQVLFKRQR